MAEYATFPDRCSRQLTVGGRLPANGHTATPSVSDQGLTPVLIPVTATSPCPILPLEGGSGGFAASQDMAPLFAHLENLPIKFPEFVQWLEQRQQ